MYLQEAILAVLAAMICGTSHHFFGRFQQDRPIIYCTVIGLLFGDLETGLKCGAALEAIFLGVAHIGAANLDYGMASVFVTSLAITTGQDYATLLPLAIPISSLGTLCFNIMKTVSTIFNPIHEKLLEDGKYREFAAARFIATVLGNAPYWIFVFIAIGFGAPVIESIVNNLPVVITKTFSVISGLMAGFGMALVLNQLWDKKLCIWLFFGFVLAKYLNLPTMAILVIAIAIAFAICAKDNGATPVAGELTEEEELFNE